METRAKAFKKGNINSARSSSHFQPLSLTVLTLLLSFILVPGAMATTISFTEAYSAQAGSTFTDVTQDGSAKVSGWLTVGSVSLAKFDEGVLGTLNKVKVSWDTTTFGWRTRAEGTDTSRDVGVGTVDRENDTFASGQGSIGLRYLLLDGVGGSTIYSVSETRNVSCSSSTNSCANTNNYLGDIVGGSFNVLNVSSLADYYASSGGSLDIKVQRQVTADLRFCDTDTSAGVTHRDACAIKTTLKPNSLAGNLTVSYTYSDIAPVPAPASIALLIIGLLGANRLQRSRR